MGLVRAILLTASRLTFSHGVFTVEVNWYTLLVLVCCS